jgi:hypothetical protein
MLTSSLHLRTRPATARDAFSLRYDEQCSLETTLSERFESITTPQERQMEADFRATCKQVAGWGEQAGKFSLPQDVYGLLRDMRDRTDSVVKFFESKGITLMPNGGMAATWTDKKPSPLLQSQGVKRIVYTITREAHDKITGKATAFGKPDKLGRPVKLYSFETAVKENELSQHVTVGGGSILLHANVEEPNRHREKPGFYESEKPAVKLANAAEDEGTQATIYFANRAMEQLGSQGFMTADTGTKT